jgi:toxin ParE1/3/4
VAEVLRFTKERWGIAKAREYRELIREALDAIAANPECGTLRHSVRHEIRGYHIKQRHRNARHIVFYRIGPQDTVQIVRFLHDSMDFNRRLR